jgi:hypothetical protein
MRRELDKGDKGKVAGGGGCWWKEGGWAKALIVTRGVCENNDTLGHAHRHEAWAWACAA